MPNEKGKRKEKQTEINLDGQVRNFFLLPTPKLTKYMYGMSDRDFQLGDCRDEQAWMLQLEYTNGTGRISAGKISSHYAKRRAFCDVMLIIAFT